MSRRRLVGDRHRVQRAHRPHLDSSQRDAVDGRLGREGVRPGDTAIDHDDQVAPGKPADGPIEPCSVDPEIGCQRRGAVVGEPAQDGPVELAVMVGQSGLPLRKREMGVEPDEGGGGVQRRDSGRSRIRAGPRVSRWQRRP